jgi:CDP-glucose 4,6-dehydratase
MSVRNLLEAYGEARGRKVTWRPADEVTMKEASRLAVDSSRARQLLHWRPQFSAHDTLTRTARWYEAWMKGDDLFGPSRADILEVVAA